MFRYASTIFISAFLVFQVQPLIGRYILPWFGGTPGVWTTCMLFFQVMLLVGYGYAHFLGSRVNSRWQGWIHLVLLLAALPFLPISPDPEIWKPDPEASPTPQILLLLLCNIGLPGVLISSTGPLLQRWFVRSFPGRSPYRLYSLSNVGSVAALLTYPFVFEPLLKLDHQVWLWSALFGVFVAGCGWCAIRLNATDRESRMASPEGKDGPDDNEDAINHGPPSPVTADRGGDVQADRPSFRTILMWLLLAATGSAHLLAMTNQLCQEVASVPFLWVLPLTLYLLTFIICFDNERWYSRGWCALLLAITVPLACYLLFLGIKIGLWIQIAGYSAMLFVLCMTCHGELSRSKPDPSHLTLFYLIVASGGVLGGVFVALIAPRIFHGYWEYEVTLAAGVLLTLIAWLRGRSWVPWFRRPVLFWGSIFEIWAVLAYTLILIAVINHKGATASERNFYGVLRVTEGIDNNGRFRKLLHGRTMHGFQYQDEDKRMWPTSYYGPETGIGLAFRLHPRRLAAGNGSAVGLRIGIAGLGTGSALVWGERGDVIRYYEINPEVEEVARKYFTYLRDTKARPEVIVGDARIMMENELRNGKSQQYDILILDAFSSNAVPIHLLTRECGQIYQRHLKDDGLMVVNISNRFVDLIPIVRGFGREFDCEVLYFYTDGHEECGRVVAIWIVLTRNQEFINHPEVQDSVWPWEESDPNPLVWTDDFSSLFQVLMP